MSSTLTIKTTDNPTQIANMANSDVPAPRHSSRNVNSAYASNNMKNHKGAAAPSDPAWVNPPATKRQRTDSKHDAEDGTHTPGPNTPATTNSGGTPAKLARPGDSSGSEGGNNNPALRGVDKKARAAWSAEAMKSGRPPEQESAYDHIAPSAPRKACQSFGSAGTTSTHARNRATAMKMAVTSAVSAASCVGSVP